MLWLLQDVDQPFKNAWNFSGEPDQAVINAYLAQTGKRLPPPKHQGIKRFYYSLADNPRIRLIVVGMRLEEWRGPAKIMVGTIEIIGEFSDNQHLRGQQGLRLQMEMPQWRHGSVDKTFRSGGELLAEISEQLLDRKAIDKSQASIQQNYQYKPPRKHS